MLINFTNGFVIDSTEFKETLAVRFSIPMDYQLKSLNGRCGIFKERDELSNLKSPDAETWLTPEPTPIQEEGDDFGFFDNTYLINRPSVVKVDQVLRYNYTIYAFNDFKKRIVVHDLLLVETHNKPWYAVIDAIIVILPDYNFIEKIHNS